MPRQLKIKSKYYNIYNLFTYNIYLYVRACINVYRERMLNRTLLSSLQSQVQVSTRKVLNNRENL